MRKWLFFLSVLVSVNYSYAQPISNDTVRVNMELIYNLQLLDPSFAYSENQDELNKRLKKSLLSDYIKVKEFENTVENDSVIQKKLNAFLALCEIKFLAQELNKSHPFSPSDQQIKEYYEKNPDKFRNPYRYSFYQIWYPTDVSEQNLKVGRRELEKRIKVSDGNYNTSKQLLDGNGALNFEQSVMLNSGYEIYPYVSNLSVGQVSDIITLKNAKILLALVRKDGGDLIPFSDAFEACKTAFINEQNAKKDKEVDEKIKKMTILLDINE